MDAEKERIAKTHIDASRPAMPSTRLGAHVGGSDTKKKDMLGGVAWVQRGKRDPLA